MTPLAGESAGGGLGSEFGDTEAGEEFASTADVGPSFVAGIGRSATRPSAAGAHAGAEHPDARRRAWDASEPADRPDDVCADRQGLAVDRGGQGSTYLPNQGPEPPDFC